MATEKPYQPLLFRVLHGVNGLLIILNLLTGFLVYNTYDGRLGKLPIPPLNKIIDIHGTLAKVFLLGVMPIFVLYSFHVGQRRLINDKTLSYLPDIGKPIWWYNLHRIVNTGLLLAMSFAVLSGGKVKEHWPTLGEFHHLWYVLHLLSWLILFFTVAIHILMVIKVGGLPLLLSMVDNRFRPQDSSVIWLKKIRSFWSRS